MSKTYVKVIFCLLFALASAQEEEIQLATVTSPAVICSLVPEYAITDVQSSVSSSVSCNCEFEIQVQGGYYFDVATQQCTSYNATCCGVASPNSFATLEVCQNTCQGVQTLSSTQLNPFTVCANAPTAQPSDATSSVSVYSYSQSTFSCQEMSISDSENIEGQNFFPSLSICQQFCEPYIAMQMSNDEMMCDCEMMGRSCDSVNFNSTTGVCTVSQSGCCTSYLTISNTDEAGCQCQNTDEISLEGFEGSVGTPVETEAETQNDFALGGMGPITCDCILADPPCFATFDTTTQQCTIRIENCCDDEVSTYSATNSEQCVCSDNESPFRLGGSIGFKNLRVAF